MTPAERRKRETDRNRRKRADPVYREREYAKNAARGRRVRAIRRAMTSRALRITFADSLPALVSVFMRDLAARSAPTNQSDA